MQLKERLLQSPAIHTFVEHVRQLVLAAEPDSGAVEAALQAEQSSLDQKCRGWVRSLSDPELAHSLRLAIQKKYDAADQRIRAIDAQLGQRLSKTDRLRDLVTPETVADRVVRLGTILEGDNASAVNLELSQHIESIRCGPDGIVSVRTCLLGAIANPLELIDIVGQPLARSEIPKTSRRRTQRDVGNAYDDDEEAQAANDFAVNPYRFAELGPEWFTEATFHVPEQLSWSERNAIEVAMFRLESKSTMLKTAEHFGKTIPTIRAALRVAVEKNGLDAFGKRLSNSTWNNWSRINALRVDEFLRLPGATIKTAARHFGKSEPTISKAKRLAAELLSSANTTAGRPPEEVDGTKQG